MDSNIPQIAQQIFSVDPQPIGSIQLGLEDCAPPNSPPEMVQRLIFEVLMNLFLDGTKVVWDDNTQPGHLTEQQLDRMRQYFMSFGFNVRVVTDHLDVPPPLEDVIDDMRQLCYYQERFFDYDRQTYTLISFEKI